MKPYHTHSVYAIGLISGTSADAIDATLIQSDGITPPRMLAYQETPYPPKVRQQILDLYEPGDNELDRMGYLDQTLGRLFAQSALDVLHQSGLKASQIRVIGSHGQTIRHRPPHFTLQIGNHFIIAANTGITTVADFRPADMARQGEGAPLTPLFHQALFQQANKRVAVVNLGGISNLTALPDTESKPLIAGDTGPANTLLDLFAQHINLGKYDKDGKMASLGHVNNKALQWLLMCPFFKQPFPKSTGRELFGLSFLHPFLEKFGHLSHSDCFATLSELTAQTVAMACKQTLAPEPHQVILCGGGAKNRDVCKRLQKHLANSQILLSSQLGVDANALEAQAFAWFAIRTLNNHPSSLTHATGAHTPAILGSIYPTTPTLTPAYQPKPPDL